MQIELLCPCCACRLTAPPEASGVLLPPDRQAPDDLWSTVTRDR